MATLPVIQIRDATVRLPGRQAPALDGINLDVRCHLAICGPNGAGKTTLLRLMGGHLPLQKGSISWLADGAPDFSRITGQEICGLVSPYMQTNLQIYAQGLTGEELLARDASTDDIEVLADKLGADAILHSPLPQLSQGQLRLVLLMREILKQPAILLLDEWAEGLDMEKRALALGILQDLAPQIIMVFASPRRDDWPDFVQEEIYINQGRLTGEPMPGPTPMPSPAPLPRRSRGEIIFELKHVHVYKERQLLLRDIDWRMRAGENWRVTGANGAGKSTLLRLLAGGEFAAAGGSFRHFSPRLARDLVTLDERKCSAPLVSDLGQALYGYPVSALELVLTGADMAEGVHREYEKQEIIRARKLLEQFLPDINAERSIRHLSSGQLRRLFLARALMGRPDALLLDEPCTGLDSDARKAFVSLLLRLLGGEAPDPLQIVLVAHDDRDFNEIPFLEARMENGFLQVLQD